MLQSRAAHGTVIQPEGDLPAGAFLCKVYIFSLYLREFPAGTPDSKDNAVAVNVCVFLCWTRDTLVICLAYSLSGRYFSTPTAQSMTIHSTLCTCQNSLNYAYSRLLVQEM